MARTVRITVDTQENLTPETFANIFMLKDKVGWFYFAEHEENLPEQIDTSKLAPVIMEKDIKSPSQRLYNALFVWWKQRKDRGEPITDNFEVFRLSQMDKIINQIKEQLV